MFPGCGGRELGRRQAAVLPEGLQQRNGSVVVQFA